MSHNGAEERQPKDESLARRMYLGRDRPVMSIDTTDGHSPRGDYHRHEGHGRVPPVSPYGSHMPNYSMRYPPFPPTPTRPLPPHLQGLGSHSTDSRDAPEHCREPVVRRDRYAEHRFEVDERVPEDEERDEWEAREDRMRRPSSFAPPRGAVLTKARAPPPSSRPFVQRAYSSPGYFAPNDTLKRSFYHHSRQSDQLSSGRLPPDFMPPKRTKMNPSPKNDVILFPRDTDSVEWGYSYPPTWEGDARFKHMVRSQSFPASPSWGRPPPSPMAFRESHAGMSPKEYAQVSPGSESDDSPASWRPGPANHWGPGTSGGAVRFWDSPRGPDRKKGEQAWLTPQGSQDMSADSRGAFQPPYGSRPFKAIVPHPETRQPQESGVKMISESPRNSEALGSPTNKQKGGYSEESKAGHRSGSGGSDKPLLLLALPEDKIALSETLCVVRENIEVFTANQDDVDAPAPGRKHSVVVGQVGLRCIHCRHTTRCSDRVKRAVCYPSSIKRIYRTVIDMKLDHFSQCKFVPASLKARLDELKAVHTRSTGTTMQYFIRAAISLGMEDGPSGVRLNESRKPGPNSCLPASQKEESKPAAIVDRPAPEGSAPVKRSDSMSSASLGSNEGGHSNSTDSMMSTDSYEPPADVQLSGVPETTFEGLVSLSLPEDKSSLSPLRCFLREQVCAFSATAEDIAVRAPTTFSISVGQVGIGCIHCVKQSAKQRSNRAVCFPFSIGRIYQSVADIQRFHFGECKMLPAAVKEKFLELQSASSKGSKGLATRQYWVTSARKIGLVDTPQGIRFGRDPSKPEETKAFSLDILAQVAFSVTTASKQLVLPEDKPCIAEFLYVVMEQLQPCRFTEADRNKRRLKNVGCIGVECKHCAGHVDSRKFFWSSVSAVESNFVSVHTHMLECKMVPDHLKQKLLELKKLRKKQTAALRTGSQKAFFARVWQRLHEDDEQAGQSSPNQHGEPQQADAIEMAPPAPPATPTCTSTESSADAPAVPMELSPSTEAVPKSIEADTRVDSPTSPKDGSLKDPPASREAREDQEDSITSDVPMESV